MPSMSHVDIWCCARRGSRFPDGDGGARSNGPDAVSMSSDAGYPFVRGSDLMCAFEIAPDDHTGTGVRGQGSGDREQGKPPRESSARARFFAPCVELDGGWCGTMADTMAMVIKPTEEDSPESVEGQSGFGEILQRVPLVVGVALDSIPSCGGVRLAYLCARGLCTRVRFNRSRWLRSEK